MSVLPRTNAGPMGYASAVIAGVASAAMLAVALMHAQTILSFLGFVTAMPLFLVGLGAGGIAALLAATIGTVGLFALLQTGAGLIYALMLGVPAALLTVLTLRYSTIGKRTGWLNEGHILAGAMVYISVLFVAAAGLSASHPGGLLDLTQQALNQTLSDFVASVPADSQADVKSTIESAQPIMAMAAKVTPAMFGTSWAAFILISLGVAQAILQQQKLSLRPPLSFRNLRAPEWLIYGVALTGVLAFVGHAPVDYIGLNLAIMLGMVFFLVGLAIVHSWTATLRYGTWVLVLFYILLSIPALWVLPIYVLVAVLGIADQWADFRARLKQKNTAI